MLFKKKSEIVEAEPAPIEEVIIHQSQERKPIMDFNQFVRRPFVVEATEITAENLSEVAALIGNLRTRDGVTYIALDRRVVPNVPRAYIGWWMTRLGDNFRCYAPKVFKAEFIKYEDSMTFLFDDVEDNEEENTPAK